MKTNPFLVTAFCMGLPGLSLSAQSSVEGNLLSAELPLKSIALFSSGVGYFEHSGTVVGQAEIMLPFDSEAVNDALKSLVVNDPGAGNGGDSAPSVRYASQSTLARTLRSLSIDLTGNPGIAEILNGLKGAELEIMAPNPITGRILGVETRRSAAATGESIEESRLSLFTGQGIKVIAIKDIAAFRFTDERINADLNRGLDLIMSSRDETARNLFVSLKSLGSRPVSLSYVVPAPVWKVSYRLDLSGASPFLQGWAIVDNDSGTDWKDVELSLVIGRPVSFIQELYPPLRLFRPVLPLSIAGIAESRSYESGYEAAKMADAYYEENVEMEMMASESSPRQSLSRTQAAAPMPAPAVAGGTALAAASGNAAGDQFEFTLRNPVTLARHQSAMLPLVEGTVTAQKTLVFSGARAFGGATINPAISAELTNTSGMKLPAGPITVYDGGIYAGDALIEFFPENERRIISYGEDLSVSGNASSSGSRYVTSVNITGGVMTISRRQIYERVYTIRNASGEAKRLIIEHPITPGSELAAPDAFYERTGTLYRFVQNLAAKATITFTVKEETPVYERVALAQLRGETFLSYASSEEIPQNVRAALAVAIELKKKADDAAAAQKEFENQRAALISEQDRIRRNLEAAGNQSPQGQEYLRRLVSLDSEIDALNGRINNASQEAMRAKREYDNYLAALSL